MVETANLSTDTGEVCANKKSLKLRNVYPSKEIKQANSLSLEMYKDQSLTVLKLLMGIYLEQNL